MFSKHLILITALGLCSALASAADTAPAFRLGPWTGHAVLGVAGCEAVTLNRQKSASLSIFEAREDGKVMYVAGVRSKSFKFGDGVTQPLSISVDGKALGSWQGRSLEGAMGAEVPKGILDAIESGGSLVVVTDGRDLEFSIAGSQGLRDAMSTCAGTPAGAGTGGNSAPAGVTTLVCSLTARNGDNGGTKTIRFDPSRRVLFEEDLLEPPTFSDTEISWRVPFAKGETTIYKLDRYAGTLSRYIHYKGESTMSRLSSGPCQVAGERKF